MEFNLEIRKRQLQSLQQYVKSSEDNLKAVFQSLGWTIPKTIEKADPKVTCPLNKQHLISQKTSQTHIEKCSLSSSGYSGTEEFLSEPSDFNSSVKIPNSKKLEIFNLVKASRSDFKSAWNGKTPDPLTADRFVSTFSVDERLALYDYSVKHTKPPPKLEEFTLELLDKKEKTELTESERLELERDAKRRRAKYKSVHTSKKSQTEVMREFIDNQMDLYVDWVKQKEERRKKEKERLKRLAKEKSKKATCSDQNHVGNETGQYHYIETTYDGSGLVAQEQSTWDPSQFYYSNGQYYSGVQTSNGVITDWSHVYQRGINNDYFSGNGVYQAEGNYATTTTTDVPLEVTYSSYTNNEVAAAVEANPSLSSSIHSSEDESESRHKAQYRIKKQSSHEKERSRERSKHRKRSKDSRHRRKY